MSRGNSYVFFIGIDVSKEKLDLAILRQDTFLFHKEIKNQVGAIIEFFDELKTIPEFTIPVTLFCMENTGVYCSHLLTVLQNMSANVVLENAYRIKHSSGLIRGKSDKSDAKLIAKYAYQNCRDFKLWKPKREIIVQLMHLLALRNRLVAVKVKLSTPLAEQKGFTTDKNQQENVNLCLDTLTALNSDLKRINKSATELVANDIRLKRLFALVTSVPGVGAVTGMHILVTTNEFVDFNDPKKFACYAGIVPFSIQSGTVTRKARVSYIANKSMKKMLHTCAVVAVTHNEELRAYYHRRTQSDGKPKMSVLNAVRNKLILRIFACVNQDRPYRNTYKNHKFEGI